MPHIRSVAVFCGAQSGHDPAFRKAAEALGTGLARNGMRLIYGGGRIGMMGAVADAVLAAGGCVTGVIPEFLTRREVAHEGVDEMILTHDMHTRKRRMFDLADAFVTMPGGLGTLDETVEIITWRQLSLHEKPILLCDIGGTMQPLLAVIDGFVRSGYAQPEVRELYEVVPDVGTLLDRLTALEIVAGSDAAALT